MWTALLLVAALPSTRTPELIPVPARAAEPPAPSVVGDSVANDSHASAEWTARDARALLARAGFAPTADEVKRAADAGREKTIEHLFDEHAPRASHETLGLRTLHGDLPDPGLLCERLDSRREGFLQLQSDHIVPLSRYGVRWVESMLDADAPVRDRMAIFWHGHLVSSFKEVGNPYEMVAQIKLLRDRALGRFDDLVRAIARDPAMLQYLSNAKNVKAHPNENWARELMELFTLGDGNYSETDIKQAARAFTGWSKDPTGFVYRRLDHDFGQKTVLGVTGNFDGDNVIDVVFAQPVCARFVAGKILAHFEGADPDDARLGEYADFFRANGYDVEKLLRRLFADPRFYRAEVAGARIESPTEYLIGVARSLELRPPAELVLAAGGVLGQRIFFPPSVKGWEGGIAWITTDSIMQRSNMVGVMLGVVNADDLSDAKNPMLDVKPRAEDNQVRTSGIEMVRYIQDCGWKPELSLCDRVAKRFPGASDADLVRGLLGELVIAPTAPSTVSALETWLGAEREKIHVKAGELGTRAPASEALLRRLVHLMLSLPEAQLD
jgi:uncharacterized protein (DUF1800 family)